MFILGISVAFLYSLSEIASELFYPTCVPNSQFLLNDQLCYCNNLGRWSSATCLKIGRRQTCQPGQIIWEDCKQCICQENGQLLCTNHECRNKATKRKAITKDNEYEIWCTPLRSYYQNCSLCVCPVTGIMSQAKCVPDSSCTVREPQSLDTIVQMKCIPRTMYLFNCFHCLCSDVGIFSKDKCFETCPKPSDSTKPCIPKTFFRSGCNICYCPDDEKGDKSVVCSRSYCNGTLTTTTLNDLIKTINTCEPHKYTKRKCFYCECNAHGVVNESRCLEQECLKIKGFNYDFVKPTCNPREMVAICMECFCPKTERTESKYCTRVCTAQNKILLLEKLLKENIHIVEPKKIRDISGYTANICDPNEVFFHRERYCLCPMTGNTNLKLCTTIVDDTLPRKVYKIKMIGRSNTVNFNITCTPYTFIEIGCNTCYCTKDGKVDKKWCTFDDCEAKKNKVVTTHTPPISSSLNAYAICVPGSLSKDKCNYCICDKSGLFKERMCTNSTCTKENNLLSFDYDCEPGSYYTVDCNICLCPLEGIKNVHKCSKIHCENRFLRTNLCHPGTLFCDECNICICPPSGQKKDKVCTKRICSETPWKRIFMFSGKLFDKDDKSLEDGVEVGFCLPGEEFEDGCKNCICPEIGLKQFAQCTLVSCKETGKIQTNLQSDSTYIDVLPQDMEMEHMDVLHSGQETDINTENGGIDLTNYGIEDRMPITVKTRRIDKCTHYSFSNETNCALGSSEYISKCRICVCPGKTNSGRFCRPVNECCHITTESPIISKATTRNYPPPAFYKNVGNQQNIGYKCLKPGIIKNACYQCKCERNLVIIPQNCFKNEAVQCANVKNSFLLPANKVYLKT